MIHSHLTLFLAPDEWKTTEGSNLTQLYFQFNIQKISDCKRENAEKQSF